MQIGFHEHSHLHYSILLTIAFIITIRMVTCAVQIQCFKTTVNKAIFMSPFILCSKEHSPAESFSWDPQIIPAGFHLSQLMNQLDVGLLFSKS